MQKLLTYILIFTLILVAQAKTSYADELTTDTHKLILDDSGLGYDIEANNTRVTDQSSEYILSGSLESFDVGTGNSDGGSYKLNTGLQPTFEANVPEVIISSTENSISLYNKLTLEIDPNDNPTAALGTLFAVQISTVSNFATFKWVNPTNFQPDNTPNSDLSVYFKPCAQTDSAPADDTRWNCGLVVGLDRYIYGIARETQYYVRAVAKNGDLSNSEPGPAATATTGDLSMTFVLSSTSSNLGAISSTAVSTGSPSTTLTMTTNNDTGYISSVYGVGSGSGAVSGLYSTTKSRLIGSVSNNLDANLGIDGYGLQAVSTSGTPTMNTVWLTTEPGRNSSYVGQILRTSLQICTRTTATTTSGDEVQTTYKATAGYDTPASRDYSDTLTYTMSVNP